LCNEEKWDSGKRETKVFYAGSGKKQAEKHFPIFSLSPFPSLHNGLFHSAEMILQK
jgi:hypothetical protein